MLTEVGSGKSLLEKGRTVAKILSKQCGVYIPAMPLFSAWVQMSISLETTVNLGSYNIGTIQIGPGPKLRKHIERDLLAIQRCRIGQHPSLGCDS